MVKIRVEIGFEMTVGEIEIFQDLETKIYTAKWGDEPLPFSSDKKETIIAMAFSAQWASRITVKKCANAIQRGL